MAVVNFIIGSDFKWLILSFALPWTLALALYWLERSIYQVLASKHAAGRTSLPSPGDTCIRDAAGSPHAKPIVNNDGCHD